MPPSQSAQWAPPMANPSSSFGGAPPVLAHFAMHHADNLLNIPLWTQWFMFLFFSCFGCSTSHSQINAFPVKTWVQYFWKWLESRSLVCVKGSDNFFLVIGSHITLILKTGDYAEVTKRDSTAVTKRGHLAAWTHLIFRCLGSSSCHRKQLLCSHNIILTVSSNLKLVSTTLELLHLQNTGTYSSHHLTYRLWSVGWSGVGHLLQAAARFDELVHELSARLNH